MEQNLFPKKIKLAMFFMVASGILLFCEFVYAIWVFKTELSQISSGQYNIFSLILANFNTLLIATLFIVFALFLGKRKKWAWFAAMVLILKEVIAGVQSIPFIFSNFSNQISQLKELQTIMGAPIFTFFIIATVISTLSFILILISLIFLIKYRKDYWQIAS